MTPMTRTEWQEQYGRYLAAERAPNGDFQVRVDLVHELLEELLREHYCVSGYVRHYRDVMYGAKRLELLGDFLTEARAELDRIEPPRATQTYR